MPFLSPNQQQQSTEGWKIQNVDDLEYDPGLHSMHWFCANWSWNMPAGHNVQWLIKSCVHSPTTSQQLHSSLPVNTVLLLISALTHISNKHFTFRFSLSSPFFQSYCRFKAGGTIPIGHDQNLGSTRSLLHPKILKTKIFMLNMPPSSVLPNIKNWKNLIVHYACAIAF